MNILKTNKIMKQTAVEWLIEQMSQSTTMKGWIEIFDKAKEMEKEQQLELIQFLADREDFKEHSSMSIFIAEDFLNQFKNK
jgi:hypothetical protein